MRVNGRSVRGAAGLEPRARSTAAVRRIRVAIDDVDQPRACPAAPAASPSCGSPASGRARRLRPPVLAERALAAAPASAAALTYLFSRDHGRRAAARRRGPGGRSRATACATASTPSRSSRAGSRRPPRARWLVDAWTTPAPATSDAALDRLAGTRGRVVRDVVGALRGPRRPPRVAGVRRRPRDRVVRALGRARAPRRRALTIAWRLPAPATVRRLRLVAPRETVRAPDARPARRRRARGRRGGARRDRRAAAARARPALRAAACSRPRSAPARRAATASGARSASREVRGVPGRPRARPARRRPVRGRCGDAPVRTAAGVVRCAPTGDAAGARARRPAPRGRAAAPRGCPPGARTCSAAPGRCASTTCACAPPSTHPQAGLTPPRPVECWTRAATARAASATACGVDVDATRLARARRGLQPRLARDVRRARPRRAGAPAGLRERLAGRAGLPRRRASRGRRTGCCRRPTRSRSLACLALLALLRRAAAARGGAAGRAAAPVPLPDPDPPRRMAGRAGARGRAGRRARPRLRLRAARGGRARARSSRSILWRGVSVAAARRSPAGVAARRRRADPLPGRPGRDRGGFNTNLAVERIAAHWVGVAAVVLLGAGAVAYARGRPCCAS